jgi:hypothetical protein
MDQIKVRDVVDAAKKLVKKNTRNRKSIRSAVYS